MRSIEPRIHVDDAAPRAHGSRMPWCSNGGPEVSFYGRREFAFRDPDGYVIIISFRKKPAIR